MKYRSLVLGLLCFIATVLAYAQEPSEKQTEGNEDYLEFNDRNNVVHGVYLGLTTAVGELDGEDTFIGGLKLAYVANQQFEAGFEGKFFYSDQNRFNPALSRQEDLIGAYMGLHLEPILFSKRKVNLSFPVLIAAGGVGAIGDDFNDDDLEEEFDEDDIDAIFVLEPGVSALFNISRYLQLEAGIKYRFSSTFSIPSSPVTRINGFSAGIGIKVGVFNLGRNRYKKNIQ